MNQRMNGFNIFLAAALFLVIYGCRTPRSTVNQGAETLENSLLWKISGNGLSKPSYLFGTIHMICGEDASLSDSLRSAIDLTDRVYLELDMDNLIEMIGAFRQMKMKKDTTLRDLLSESDYEKVKEFINSKNSMLPFSVLETYKPLLTSSLIMESGLNCDNPVAMEMLIMEEAKKRKKRIEGLETMAYQLSIFDSIPYRLQAEELLKYATIEGDMTKADKEFNELMKAYREQNLEKMHRLVRGSEGSILAYEDILLNNRNRNWVFKLNKIMKERPVTIAVGAGHLPGENGLISLLRKAGYKVNPVKNEIYGKRVI